MLKFLRYSPWFKQILLTSLFSSISHLLAAAYFDIPELIYPTIPYTIANFIATVLYFMRREVMAFYFINIAFAVILPFFSYVVDVDMAIVLCIFTIAVNNYLILDKHSHIYALLGLFCCSFLAFGVLSSIREEVLVPGLHIYDLLLSFAILLNLFNTLNQYRIERSNRMTQLDNKNAELKKYISSNIQLEQFAHIASHDLKSPLRTISSFSNLLKRKIYKDLDAENKESFDYIETGTQQMSELVNDLLQFSKVNSQVLSPTQVDLETIKKALLLALKFDIESSNAKVKFSGFEGIIYFDESKIKQVLQNLISNAIKFSREGIDPVVEVEQLKVSDKKVRFSVTDNGIGIEREYFEQIFDSFKKLHPKAQYEGSGLGLAICQKIIEKHGGSIWLDSKIGKGTTFYFDIPSVKMSVQELALAHKGQEWK